MAPVIIPAVAAIVSLLFTGCKGVRLGKVDVDIPEHGSREYRNMGRQRARVKPTSSPTLQTIWTRRFPPPDWARGLHNNKILTAQGNNRYVASAAAKIPKADVDSTYNLTFLNITLEGINDFLRNSKILDENARLAVIRGVCKIPPKNDIKFVQPPQMRMNEDQSQIQFRQEYIHFESGRMVYRIESMPEILDRYSVPFRHPIYIRHTLLRFDNPICQAKEIAR